MYLSKLEIVGFKSFAQKTLLKFTGGISAVVGPNGCGKTNIVDAIRWVLGEQKTSVLRSDVMENVIFNGTKSRKPLSMAEVSLTIENTKNILPTEYSEVTITRRLFRNGDSDYLLNRTKCRLRDIIDLFMDTGLGSDSYSVIELKMVEAILSGRAEERRTLFEEAAGIKKYKIRRKETARKLDSVLNDLLRVNDILEEVRKNVNSLSRQASKTRRYNNLMTEYKELEIKLLDYQFNLLMSGSKNIENDINEFNKTRIKSKFELSSLEENLAVLKTKFEKIDAEHQFIHEEENKKISDIADKKRELAVNSEKLASIDSSKIRIEQDILESKQMLEFSENNLNNLNNELKRKNEKKIADDGEFVNIKSLRDELAKVFANAKEKENDANRQVYSLHSSINNFKQQSSRLSDRKITLEQKIQGSFEESHKVQSQIDLIEDELKDEGIIKTDLEEELSEAEQLLNSEKERRIVLQNNIDNLKIKVNENRNLLNNKKSSLDFLKNLVAPNETTKYLLKSNEWSESSEKLQLAEAIAIDDEYRTAVIAAINFIGDFFLTDTLAEAESAISCLKKDNKGRAAIIAKELVPATEQIIHNGKDGQIGILSELVRCEDKVRDALRLLLGNCLVVENLNIAIDAIKEPNIDAAATLSGEVVHKSGYIFGGSYQKNDSGILGKKEKMDGLKNDISDLSNIISDLESLIKERSAELNEIDLPTLTTNVRSAETKLNNFQQKTAQSKLRLQALEQSLQLVSESNSRLESEIDDIIQELSSIDEQIIEFTNQLEIETNNLKQEQSELSSIEKKLNQINENLKQVEIAMASISSEINSINSEISRQKNAIHSINSKIQRMNDEIVQSDLLKHQLSEKIFTTNDIIKNQENELNDIRNKRDFRLQEKNSLSEQITQYSDDLIEHRKHYDKIKQSIHEKELKLSEFSTQLNMIREKYAQDYQINPDEHSPTLDDDFSLDNSKAELTEIKNKLAAIGSVNFLALEEFEKESERLNFYEKQIKDLTDAEKTLKETIEEINRKAERNFIETYDKIHSNFKKLFKTLFGDDGESVLKIDVTNVLETDIEIIAKPPNKRPNSIEQLSGGEKTLTAIALLFAIYLVKPSPFCILDEVDAPLDDANVDKFVKLIKEFSFDTQFLIVTHNKKTMTAADTLYGVTMQEVGVSKTVSVALNRTETSF